VGEPETAHRSSGAGEPAEAPRRRADAERSIAAILEAALVCFGANAQTSMADIAREAGVGRVTLYAHFPSREALLYAVLRSAIDEAVTVIHASDLDTGAADAALERLIRRSWRQLDRHRRLFHVAQRVLEPDQLRQQHDRALTHVEGLLSRGRAEGVFRDDLPLSWLVTTFYSLLHAAGEDVNVGRLDPENAADVLVATLRPALARPE
jgi:AcrR family transcriptional regulator